MAPETRHRPDPLLPRPVRAGDRPDPSVPARAAAAGLVFALASGFLSGCGSPSVPSAAELDGRAQRAGVTAELVYVTKMKGYHRATGGMGGYGDDGFQDIYVSDKGDVRLTVERRALTAADCPSLPVPAATSPGGSVRCVRDGDGWRRTSGDRQEYAVAKGDLLVRVSGRVDTTTFDLLRDAATDAHAASREELDEMLPPGTSEDGPGGRSGRPPTPPERGDLPETGDGAPDNHVGRGG
ncbi:hypothetical protein [Actinomadura sp. HBU206391]|uniref:hypothetical protein n=1 Tax=Actinomadura sp. HBU206391 TaxID=2731692 RepID=UPI00164EFBD3|nr:hypothetical protein [Actinomadura sp. HBU206391]MBC6457928.1 hypothetical protein [Actinomadura sp. HBU206391]